MTAADAPPDSAKGMSAAMSEKANTVLQAAADKPADAEAPADARRGCLRPAQQHRPVVDPFRTASCRGHAERLQWPRPPDRRRMRRANDSSTLDKTSLIGKVFIAFGALLTLASAARMFMA